MEEEIKQVETISVPETPVQLPKKSNLPRIVLLVILGLLAAGGLVYAGMNIGKKQSTPKVIPQITEVSPTPDETANWKTYRNEKFGFEFKYPQNWKINDKKLPDDAIFRIESDIDSGVPYGPIDPPPTLPYSIVVGIIENAPNLDEWITNNNAGIKSKITTMKNNDFIYYKAIDVPSMSGELNYYIPLNQKGSYLNLSLSPYFEPDEYKEQKEAVKLFDQILSTFKFLDQNQNDEIANWKTYTNTRYSIKYPENWIFYQAGDMVKFQTFSEPSPGYGGFPGGENDIQVSLSVAENTSDLTLQQYFEKLSQGRVVKSKELVLVDGISAVKVSYDQEVGAGMPEIYLVGGNYIVEAGVFGGGAIKDKALLVFDQILSTFKFLE